MGEVKTVYIENDQQHQEASQRASQCGTEVQLVDRVPVTPHYRDGKRNLGITAKRGESMDTCATISDKYVCCNVKVLKSVSNCPFDCSYCFLQNYLNNGTTQVVGNVAAMVDEIKEKVAAQPWRFFRIGTWELGDSLALEAETGQAQALIQAFRDIPNAVLELKTKSDCVDTLLDLDHKGRTVVSWSMNTARIIREQEHKTASLAARLEAIEKVAKAGYPMGFHFDPMIWHTDYQAGYTEVVDELFKRVDPSQVAWLSVGSLRFNPEMKAKMRQNFPKSDIWAAEMVLANDGKYHYVKPLRLEMYDFMVDLLATRSQNQSFIYLCMERWDVWERVMGYSPSSIGDLDYRFAASLQKRFPGLVHDLAPRDTYIAFEDT